MRMVTAAAVLSVVLAAQAGAEHRELPTGGFEVTHELVLPGTPVEIYDAITGDISAWWDHSVSEHPFKLYIEPRPGGAFWEIFDAEGDGVKHAEVTLAQRGKRLRFEGPLGLGGHAIRMVHTYEFEAAAPGDEGAKRTRFVLTVRAWGETGADWPRTVDSVWHHFLFERFRPYVESGGHKQ